MLDLEDQLKSYARATMAVTHPVRSDEVRSRRAASTSFVPRLLAVAAAVLAVIGVAAVVVRDGGDDKVITTVDENGAAFLRDLGGNRDWLVALVNGEIDPDDAELERRFAASFLATVPPDDIRSLPEDLAGSAPWRLLGEVERRDDALAVGLVGADGQQARLTLAVDGDGRMIGATVLMARPCSIVGAEAATLPSPLADRLAWALDAVAADRRLTDAELSEHLDGSFLAAVPAEEMRRRFDEVRALAPLHVRGYEGALTTSDVVVALVGIRTGEEARLTVRISPDAPHRITELTLLTEQPCADPG